MSESLPPSVESLKSLEYIVVKRQYKVEETKWTLSRVTTYFVCDHTGKPYLQGNEGFKLCCSKNVPGTRRLDIDFIDQTNKDQLNFTKSGKCLCSCCFTVFCRQKINVSSPMERRIGQVRQIVTFRTPTFRVKTIEGVITYIRRSKKDRTFVLLDKTKKNEIGKMYFGLPIELQEKWNDRTAFCIHFTQSLDVKSKVTMLGALFMLKILYSEYKQ